LNGNKTLSGTRFGLRWTPRGIFGAFGLQVDSKFTWWEAIAPRPRVCSRQNIVFRKEAPAAPAPRPEAH
jgi:hypothetical protein